VVLPVLLSRLCGLWNYRLWAWGNLSGLPRSRLWRDLGPLLLRMKQSQATSTRSFKKQARHVYLHTEIQHGTTKRLRRQELAAPWGVRTGISMADNDRSAISRDATERRWTPAFCNISTASRHVHHHPSDTDTSRHDSTRREHWRSLHPSDRWHT
jgi:hypothetical protein